VEIFETFSTSFQTSILPLSQNKSSVSFVKYKGNTGIILRQREYYKILQLQVSKNDLKKKLVLILEMAIWEWFW